MVMQWLWLLPVLLLFGGCAIASLEQPEKERLEFTVLSEERIPTQLLQEIQKQGTTSFTLAYSDGEFLYLVVSYGEQQGTGYSIVVEEFAMTDQAVYVDTTLLGPEGAQKKQGSSCPVIVLKTQKQEKTIIFQ